MILGLPDFSVQPSGLPAADDSLFFHFDQGKILMNTAGAEPKLPEWAMVSKLFPSGAQLFELAHINENGIFSPHPHAPVKPLPVKTPLEYVDFNIFRSLSPENAGVLTSWRHLWSWYENNRFCGKCATPFQPDAHERALRCPACGHLLFPAIAPAVIVAITCGDRILLARNVRYQHYALIAGYVEVGETLEHALRREVMEEVGLAIHSIRFLGDQPWGVSGSHMFGFHAQADDRQPLRIQKKRACGHALV